MHDLVNQSKNFLDSLPDAVLELDAIGTIVYINKKGIEQSGYHAGDIIGQNICILFPEELHIHIRKSIHDILHNESRLVEEWEIITRDRKCAFPVRVSANVIVDGGAAVRIMCVFIDISEHKTLENKLRKSEERLRWLSDMAREGIAICRNGYITDVNKACCDIFGCENEQLIGRSIYDLVMEECRDVLKNYIDNLMDGAPCEIMVQKKNGDISDLEFTARIFWAEGQKNYTFLFNDITHRKQFEYMQSHDELTHLLNFRGFISHLQEEIEQSISKSKKLAVMTIRVIKDEYNVIKDLDPELERVLINTIPMEIGDRMKSILFREDTFARTGEFEYMTIHPLPGTHNVGSSVKLINKVLNAFTADFVQGLRLKTFIGVTFYPDDHFAKNPNKIISNSRYACDEAMSQKKEYMFYDEKSHRDTRERIEFVKDLIIAVKEEKCKNFILHYQPKVNQESSIVGIEALIRWKNMKWGKENNGLVPPNKFIQISEEIGLIGEIGNWVLMEACRQTKKWQEQCVRFKDLQIAVNVSPSQLTDEFVDYLDSVVTATGISPDLIELEITERESVKERNARILESIREKKVSIAIDDFGIDYSALSKLPKLAINTIKLDKSYIDSVATDPGYENLVHHTIRMVHGLNYVVVAEGVENSEQARKLFHEMDCDKIQGYYFYKPMPPEEIEKILKKNLDDE
jgi:PAS domain S-box-containing protein